ncbi:hypothetical protein PTKIN_Ptkin04bG0159600 [Pterospermum kingtungense]
MEVYGKTMAAAPANVIYLSTILGRDGPIPVHKCDWKCQNEHVCGNMYRCKLTGITHICDKNCNQRILYDNHSSLCRASGQVFPLTQAEEQAVRGVRRKFDADNSPPSDSCGCKRRRDAQFHSSPFERSFSAVTLSLVVLDIKTLLVSADELGSVISLLPAVSNLAFGGITIAECMVDQPYSSQTLHRHLQTATSCHSFAVLVVRRNQWVIFCLAAYYQMLC